MGDEASRRRAGEAVEVVLGGAGEGARAWLDLLRRSPRLRLVATVTRGDVLATEVPSYPDLSAALAAHRGSAFALALPPRAALEGALELAAAGEPGVVGAPLHDALCEAALPAGAAGVRVAHGWVTLPGKRLVDKVLARAGTGRIAVEVAGAPDGEGDLDAALAHALALVRSLLPSVAVAAARSRAGEVAVDLTAPGAGGQWSVALRVRRHGARLDVRVDSAVEPLAWTCGQGRETVVVGERTIAAHAAPSAAQRALAQLLDAPRGDDLRAAAAVMGLCREVVTRLPNGLPPGSAALRRSASIASRRPDDLLARLGLHGSLPSGGGETPSILDLSLPAEPFELWAFRAGIKPVAFLTVSPDAVDDTVAHFGAAHCERRERRVSVGAQDRWDDRRDRGEPRVELFISNEAALARRAAHLQTEVDPSAAVRELGELVGYPACCVEAFAAQDDRSNNSLNRYHSWQRTAAVQPPASVWPWQLNNLHTVIAPFYPCSYRCEHALAWARAALAEMDAVYPETVERLREGLARPVLYFDHDHQITLDGRCDGESVVYRSVALPQAVPDGFARLAAGIGGGDTLLFGDDALVVTAGGREILRLTRTDPGLGFVAPFGLE